MAAEIDKLNQDIQKLQGEKNALLIEIQQKQHEIYNLQNMLTETMSAAEKNHERLIKEKEDEANNKHNRIMAEKNIEMQNIIQKYQDLETRFNQLGQNLGKREMLPKIAQSCPTSLIFAQSCLKLFTTLKNLFL